MKNFGDIVEKNGKTIRENNLALTHKIPIDTLVEVKYDQWFVKKLQHEHEKAQYGEPARK